MADNEKTPMEKALEKVPSAREMIEEIGKGDDTIDFPEAYQTLRTVESAYVHLEELGLDVADQLKERRYQIAEMAAHVLLTDLDELVHAIKARNMDEGTLGDFFVGIERDDYVPTLTSYLNKIVPGWAESAQRSAEYSKIFPEAE